MKYAYKKQVKCVLRITGLQINKLESLFKKFYDQMSLSLNPGGRGIWGGWGVAVVRVVVTPAKGGWGGLGGLGGRGILGVWGGRLN